LRVSRNEKDAPVASPVEPAGNRFTVSEPRAREASGNLPNTGSSLLVIAPDQQQVLGGPYVLSKLIPVWESLGIRVRVGSEQEGNQEDVAFLHVDLTLVPDDLMERAHRYREIINGRATDMSKRRVSRHLVERRGSWSGPVIVKTDLNYGGRSERAHAAGGSGPGRLGRVRRRLPWTISGDLKPAKYPVYPSKREVPLLVWLNGKLVVEEFRPERKGEFYCLRNWVFLGSREMTVRSWGRSPVLKAADIVDHEYDIEVPDELRRLREDLGFDFGKFDFVLNDGKVCLFDANRTPTVAQGPPKPKADGERDRLAELAEGIFDWVAR